MESIKFRNKDMAWDIAALILTPPDFDPAKKYPTIISVHPFGSCKEQTSSAVYGKRLAENRGLSSLPMMPAIRANPVANPAGSRIRRSGSKMSATSSTMP